MRHLGGHVTALYTPFRCLLHRGCFASLIRGANGEIVYHDPSLATAGRQFQTIAELAAALWTGAVPQLRGFHLAAWSLRLLHSAGLVELPDVRVPPVADGSPEVVEKARDGFELLIRCRSFVDPGMPVPYTRRFVESWCCIPMEHSRAAIAALIRQGVIVKVGEVDRKSPGRRPAHLYVPGEVSAA